MEKTFYDTASARAMLERARQVLELTHYDWRLNEGTQSRRRKASKAHAHHVPFNHSAYGLTHVQPGNAFA